MCVLELISVHIYSLGILNFVVPQSDPTQLYWYFLLMLLAIPTNIEFDTSLNFKLPWAGAFWS